MHSPETTSMQAGESRLLRLHRGTCVHVSAGQLTLREMPGWLDTALPVPARCLWAGAVYVAQRSIWLRLDAQTACRLTWRVHAPAASSAPSPAAAPAAAWRMGWRVRLLRWWAATGRRVTRQA